MEFEYTLSDNINIRRIGAFLERHDILLLGVFGFIFFILGTIMFIAGFVYMYDCSAQPYIPSWSMCMGMLIMIEVYVTYCRRIDTYELDKKYPRPPTNDPIIIDEWKEIRAKNRPVAIGALDYLIRISISAGFLLGARYTIFAFSDRHRCEPNVYWLSFYTSIGGLFLMILFIVLFFSLLLYSFYSKRRLQDHSRIDDDF